MYIKWKLTNLGSVTISLNEVKQAIISARVTCRHKTTQTEQYESIHIIFTTQVYSNEPHLELNYET